MRGESFFLLLFRLLAIAAAADSPPDARFAIEAGFTAPFPGFEDPYGFPAGGALVFETKAPLDFPVSLGAVFGLWGFVPRREAYSDSLMILPMLSLSRLIGLGAGGDAGVGLRPFVRFGQYFRRHRFAEREYWGSRPAAEAGAEVVLRTEENLTFGAGLCFVFFFDNEIVPGIGYRGSTGYEIRR